MCVEAADRGGWRGYHQEAAAKNLLLLTKCFGSWCSNIPDTHRKVFYYNRNQSKTI